MNYINYYGLWTYPVSIIAVMIITYLKDGKISSNLNAYMCSMLIALALSVYVYSLNKIAKKNGKKNFYATDAFGAVTKTEYQMTERYKHLYPTIEEEFTMNTPNRCLFFGKSNSKYIAKPLSMDGHVFVFGASGAGKSSGIAIPTILANDKNVGMLVIDIKGELNSKTQRIDDNNVIVLNPFDRSKYGYNPLYMLTAESSEDEIVEVMEDIAITLIPISKNSSDSFWKLSARNLFIGLATYLYKNGNHDLATILSIIRKKSLKDFVKEVCEITDEDEAEIEFLSEMANGADDTVAGIIAELKSNLNIFRNPDIKYFLRDNPNRITPKYLTEASKKIFIVIPEKKLKKISVLLRLIIEQFICELMSRSELDDSELRPVIILIDEFARVCTGGKIESLTEGIKTLRSKKVQFMLLSQTKEGMLNSYSEDEVEDLINNCQFKIITSSTSLKTDEWVCNAAGEYKERNFSYTGNSNNNARSNTISFSYEKIMRPSDLLELKKKEEFILLTPLGYKRIKAAPYYRDPFLKDKIENIKEVNRILSV